MFRSWLFLSSLCFLLTAADVKVTASLPNARNTKFVNREVNALHSSQVEQLELHAVQTVVAPLLTTELHTRAPSRPKPNSNKLPSTTLR